METTIPFMGFYESIHAERIDSFLGVSENDYYEAEHGHSEDTVAQLEKRHDAIDWATEHINYAKQYVDQFFQSLGIKKYKFVELSSPREYNFTTDRIFVDIPVKAVLKIYNSVDREALEKRIKESFTSYDGFASFYSNDLLTWEETPVEHWDHNQIGTLIEVFAEQELSENYEFDIMDYCYC